MSLTNIDVSKYRNKGLSGLANLGNTCFLNSAVQCISHTYELNDFFDKDNKGMIEKKDNKDTLVYREWNELRKLMWVKNCCISPGRFVSSIQHIAEVKKRDLFTGFAQNDLPEFFLFLMDEIHNAFKRSVKMNITGEEKTEKDKLAMSCYSMLEKMYSKEYSEIVKLFYGIHVSQIFKEDNKDIILSQNPEPFFMINLPIPKRKTLNIYECFDLFTNKEKLEGDNKWLNEKTNTYEDAIKQIQFFSLPDILVIDLKRFDNRMRKNNCCIDFPLENLDLSKYIIGYDEKSYTYDCYGICNHSGSSLGGHYTSYVKNANDKWYHFNDTNVSEVENKNKMVSSKAYCLFYRKK